MRLRLLDPAARCELVKGNSLPVRVTVKTLHLEALHESEEPGPGGFFGGEGPVPDRNLVRTDYFETGQFHFHGFMSHHLGQLRGIIRR